MRNILFIILILYNIAFAKVKITTTIKPLADIAKEVCKKNCIVEYVIPENISFHNYEYKYSDLKKIYSSDLFIFIGSGEPQIQNITKNLKKEKLFPVYKIKGIKLITNYEFENHHHDDNDNHEMFHPALWLDPKNAKVIAFSLYKKLSSIDKQNTKIYLQNFKIFEDKINKVIKFGNDKFSHIKNKDFVSYHYAYPYFTQRFNLNYVAVVELGHGKKPTIKHINYVIKTIKKRKIKSIFASKQFYNAKYVNLVRNNTNIKVIILDPFGKGKSYIETIKEIINKVYSGLKENG